MSIEPIFVDVMNLAFRSHYALPDLSYDGVRTGMLHGFMQAVRRLQQYSPAVVFCWDTPHSGKYRTWRYKYYQGYKKSRAENEHTQAVFANLPALRQLLLDMGYSHAGVPGLEADDVIGILAQRGPSIIYSNDSDLYQLLSPQTRMLTSSQQDLDFVVPKEVEEQAGVPIDKWSHYLAFGAGHNDVHPLPNVGPKRAQVLVTMGASADHSWQQQPLAVRKKFPSLADYWPQVLAAYRVTQIPQRVDDERLRGCLERRQLDAVKFPRKRGVGREQFFNFCLQYGLSKCLVQERQFFC